MQFNLVWEAATQGTQGRVYIIMVLTSKQKVSIGVLIHSGLPPISNNC